MLFSACLEKNFSLCYVSCRVAIGSDDLKVVGSYASVTVVEHVLIVPQGCHVGETGSSVLNSADVGHRGLQINLGLKARYDGLHLKDLYQFHGQNSQK